MADALMYLRYSWTVIQHKWFVAYAGVRLGVPLWQLLIHDASKFSRAEFGPYARRFARRPASSPSHVVDPQEWRDAWQHHWTHNAHHWQHWCGGDGRFLMPMPERYAREMVADWCGAGRAYTGTWDVATWYARNRQHMILHADTRAFVEQLIDGWAGTKANPDA
jgi:hypothetical protein